MAYTISNTTKITPNAFLAFLLHVYEMHLQIKFSPTNGTSQSTPIDSSSAVFCPSRMRTGLIRSDASSGSDPPARQPRPRELYFMHFCIWSLTSSGSSRRTAKLCECVWSSCEVGIVVSQWGIIRWRRHRSRTQESRALGSLVWGGMAGQESAGWTLCHFRHKLSKQVTPFTEPSGILSLTMEDKWKGAEKMSNGDPILVCRRQWTIYALHSLSVLNLDMILDEERC